MQARVIHVSHYYERYKSYMLLHWLVKHWL